ncbi:MAG: hypothetical protein ACRDX8_04930 [Acidimicrobiales bacterium]
MLAILGSQALARAIANAFGSAIAAGVRSIAGWVVNTFIHALTTTTTPHLVGGWFSQAWEGEVAVAIAFSAPFIIAGAVQSLVHGEPGEMGMRLIGGTAVVALVLGAGRELIQGMVVAVDGACTMLLNIGAGGPAHVAQVWGTVAGASAGVGMLATLSVGPAVIAGVVIILAGVAIWVELATRMAIIYLLVAFAPLSVVGLYWQWGARWARRLGEVLMAVIISQLVITTVFVIGTDALGSASSGGAGAQIGALATAIGMMLLGTIALPAALRLAPHVTEAASTPLGQAAGKIHAMGQGNPMSALRGSGKGAGGGGGGGAGEAGAAAASAKSGPLGTRSVAAFGRGVASEAQSGASVTPAGRIAGQVVAAGKFASWTGKGKS